MESNLFTNGISKGNLFIRTNLNQNITITSSITTIITIITIITNNGILMYNIADEQNLSGLSTIGT